MTDDPTSQPTIFHFHWARRQEAIEVAEKILSGLRDRVLPVFAEAYAADQRYVERMHEKLAEEKEDGVEVTEEELQEALGLYDERLELDVKPAHELNWIASQLLHMSLVGLFHQWERTLKRFFAAEFRRNGFAEEWITRALRAEYSLLRKWIEALGFPPAQSRVLDELHSLLLIANVAKHGDGDACLKLAKKHPDFFWKLSDEKIVTPSAERLDVPAQFLENYGATIVVFWRALPERGTVGVQMLREPVLAKR